MGVYTRGTKTIGEDCQKKTYEKHQWTSKCSDANFGTPLQIELFKGIEKTEFSGQKGTWNEFKKNGKFIWKMQAKILKTEKNQPY